MAWVLLPVNYTDAVWNGLKKYAQVNNDDGTVSFQDLTVYSSKESSFFGAKDANKMNEALNIIMSMVENGTDLYTAFQNYFSNQKALFENGSNIFKAQKEQIFNQWFTEMKNKLSGDVAGNLQNQCTELDERLNLLEFMTIKNDFTAAISTDDTALTLLVDDLDFAILADWKY